MKIAILTTDNREHLKDYSNPAPHFGAAPEALLQGFARLPEAEVHVVSCVRQPMQSPEKLAENIWYHPVIVPKIGWMTTAYQGCIRAVRKKLREIGPDIVHGQGTERDCAMTAIHSGFPNVLTIHGNMAELARLFGAPPFRYHWLAARLEDWALPRTAGVFCNSAYTESLVRPRAKKVWRVPNAIRMPFFDVAAAKERFKTPTIINVGVICPRKRQLEILQLAEELHQDGLRAQFLFVGALPLGDECQKLFCHQMKAAEAAGYAFHVGTKTPEELVELFDQAGAMLHFPNEEAFGLVVAEALARNMKFFGSALGGIVEIASGLELAELHVENDWASLKKSIAGWLEQGCPRPMSASAEIAARYHPQVIAREHLAIYREVLGRSAV